MHMPGSTLLNFRLIDTETSAIPKVITRKIDLQGSLEKEIGLINRHILKTVMKKYPLQGYVGLFNEAEHVLCTQGMYSMWQLL